MNGLFSIEVPAAVARVEAAGKWGVDDPDQGGEGQVPNRKIGLRFLVPKVHVPCCRYIIPMQAEMAQWKQMVKTAEKSKGFEEAKMNLTKGKRMLRE